MVNSFLPSLLVPIVGLLTPFLVVVFFLIFVNKDSID